ncbi:sensory rhodopsin transducer [Pseudochryseolinea flava]|uniref:Sensory rhodopsin transducer n=1 Tax=Pseudochryseolinea flava TaxID=2059302 RepID=A0A364Y975_9BACT|nr:sensory rhodopsin transducer [Pseudochryseolinea flava]RAW02919.1 sensory rhodopsin transducer [Pseudochryseolinea flava]
MMHGKTIWSFSAGRIPLNSHGPEPMFTSHDKISILNMTNRDADIAISIFYEDDREMDVKSIVVKSERLRKIRFNDLINPLPIPLDTPFSFVLVSSVPVIVQFSRVITAQRELAGIVVTPYYHPHE